MRNNQNTPTETPLDRLVPWGWNDAWKRAATNHGAPPLLPGRVIRHVHHHYQIVTPHKPDPVWIEISGAFSYRAADSADYPTIGDWILHTPGGQIQKLLPRKTAISRHAAGEETREQVIAANIDVVYLVFGLDGGRNFTIGMLERSLLVTWNSGARPVVVLNKTDCADEETIARLRHEAEANAPGVAVHTVSAHSGDGLDGLLAEAGRGETVGMLGKSGVGKSALLNAFVRRAAPDAPAPARTGEQRARDRQGRHTTTDKVLHLLPGGMLLADVPGLRELQLWGDDTDLSAAFPEVDALAAECRFNDCTHIGEPGCRVREALDSAELPADRYERYLEYQRELAYLERRKDQRANAEEQKKWRRIAMEQRRFKSRGT
ncbi:MAG: ribosome small subunit-dependent GTPase A [Spirochaeta sp.]|jgi:ribosome biogenesis GTPase|nr:ribosome small subunit-dependent GTPase A [Spirochaeta sp.]